MSEKILAPLIAIGILAAMFLWVPTLHVCNDRCQKLLRGRARRKEEAVGGVERGQETA